MGDESQVIKTPTCLLVWVCHSTCWNHPFRWEEDHHPCTWGWQRHQIPRLGQRLEPKRDIDLPNEEFDVPSGLQALGRLCSHANPVSRSGHQKKGNFIPESGDVPPCLRVSFQEVHVIEHPFCNHAQTIEWANASSSSPGADNLPQISWSGVTWAVTIKP